LVRSSKDIIRPYWVGAKKSFKNRVSHIPKRRSM
jgi:hypothetical protein